MPDPSISNTGSGSLPSEHPALPWSCDDFRLVRRQEMHSLMAESKERFIEIMLAEVNLEIADVTSPSFEEARIVSTLSNYRIAVIIARLNLLLQNRYLLTGARAFEQLTSLRRQVESLMKTHWGKLDPFKLTNDKWTELRMWMLSIEQLEDEVKTLERRTCHGGNLLPGKAELERTRNSLQQLVTDMPFRLLSILSSMPAEAVENGRLIPELADFATLQQLIFKASDEDLVKRFEELHTLVTWPCDLAEHPLMQKVKKALAQTQALLNDHSQHTRSLRQAHNEYLNGNIDSAKHLIVSLKSTSFADLEYSQIRKNISRAVRLINHLKTEKRKDAVIRARKLLEKYPGIHADSQIYREAMAVIERSKPAPAFRRACVSLVVLTGLIVLGLHLKKKSELEQTLPESALIENTSASKPAAKKESIASRK